MLRRVFLAGSMFAATVACSAVSAQEEREFYLGSDLSYANEMDDCGAVFRDDGEVKDVYELFADKGNDLVRLRLWHNPDWTEYSTLDDVKRSIRRAKEADMKVLLDFHYSDDWADPGDQIIPAAWEDIETDEALAEALFTYTVSVLTELHEEGLDPDMVQVGNETNTEVLLPANVPEETEIDWERNVLLLNAGILGVQEAARVTGHMPDIMLHIAQPEYLEPWFDDAFEAGILDFDYIGMSYYPKWSTRDMEAMGQTIRRLRHKYGKEIIVVETSYPWTLEGQDQAGNILGEDSLIEGYPATLQGQKDYLIDLTQTVKRYDGSGVVYWEPAWVSNDCSTRWGEGSHWENNTFFDYESTNAHSGFDFLTADYSEPVSVTFSFEADSSEPAYLWASFLEGNDFTIKLRAEDGAYRYQARLPAGEEIRYQLFAGPDLSMPMIGDGEEPGDMPSFVVDEGPMTVTAIAGR